MATRLHLTATGPLTRNGWRALVRAKTTPRSTDSVGRPTIQCAQTEGYGPIFCTVEYAMHQASARLVQPAERAQPAAIAT
jgi:hypothetical protein